MSERFPYYEGRWSYTSAALTLAADLIKRRHLRTALELGAPLRPIIVGAHVMDVTARPELDPRVPITVHDATQEPWPFEDKAFDLFVALQVFEHLGDRQPEAFREVRRIARNAILSLPIDWEMERSDQLPPPDPQRAGAVVVRADRPDPSHQGEWRQAAPHDLRLRGPARLTPVRAGAEVPAPSWS